MNLVVKTANSTSHRHHRICTCRGDGCPHTKLQYVFVSGDVSHSRQKRLIAYNYDEQRITFPPGAVFFITPTLNVPFIRNLKKGFESKLTISAPFQSEYLYLNRNDGLLDA